MTEKIVHYHGPACDPPHRGEQFLGDHGDEVADLRAKVEALRRPPLPWVPIDDVLALLPEVSE